MSGLKPIALTEFYRSLHGRGMTTEKLAAELDVSGSTVRKLISMNAPLGGPTWRYLLSLLTDRERELLESVEHSSTWNAKRPPAALQISP